MNTEHIRLVGEVVFEISRGQTDTHKHTHTHTQYKLTHGLQTGLCLPGITTSVRSQAPTLSICFTQLNGLLCGPRPWQAASGRTSGGLFKLVLQTDVLFLQKSDLAGQLADRVQALDVDVGRSTWKRRGGVRHVMFIMREETCSQASALHVCVCVCVCSFS